MNRGFLVLLVLSGVWSAGQAQHPFYLQRLEDGRLAMAQSNWEFAEKMLNIAAFGILEDKTALAEIRVRMVLVAEQLKDKEGLFEAVSLADRFLGAEPVMPENILPEEWDAFLVITGKKPPPIPQDPAALAGYVEKYPDHRDGWIALIESQFQGRDRSALRQSISGALEKFPGDPLFLERGLWFSLALDRGKKAEEYGTALLKADPDASLANEFFGNEAIKKKDYEGARSYYEKIAKPALPETQKFLAQLDRHDKDVEEAAKKEAAKKERQAAIEAARAAKLEQAKAKAKKRQPDPVTTNPPAPKKKTGKDAKKDNPKKGRGKKADPDKTKKDTAVARKPTVQPKDKPADRAGQPKGRQVKQAGQPSDKSVDRAEPPKPVVVDENALRQAKIREQRALWKANPTSANLYKMISLYLDDRDFKEAKKLIKKMEPSSSDYLDIYARYNYLKKEYKQNINVFGKMADISKEVRYYLGMSYYRMSDFDSSRRVLAPLDRTAFPDLVGFDKEISRQSVSTPGLSSRKMTRRIRDLESAITKSNAVEPRISLLRLYTVIGNGEAFSRMHEELAHFKLTSEHDALVLAWTLCRQRRYATAAGLLAPYRSEEALFLQAYLHYQQGEREKSEQILTKFKDSHEFPEAALLLQN